MNDTGPRFVLPLTLSGSDDISTNASTRCTNLLAWNIGTDKQSGGAAMGMADGTISFFRSSLVHKSVQSPLVKAQQLQSRPSSPLQRSDATPRSGSPSSFMLSPSPFNVSSRSRIVSGVTAEQVEAPKNYVDFEEEPGKLKGMLRGRNPKDKPEVDAATPAPAGDRARSNTTTRQRKDAPKSLISTANSPSLAPTPLSGSVPGSPFTHGVPDTDLSFLCHIIPSNPGSGKSIVDMCIFGANDFIAALQETGELSFYCTLDGTCAATTCMDDTPLLLPAGVKDISLPHDVWVWKRLQVFNVGAESPITILFASATIDVTTPTPPTLDRQDDENQQRSRLVVFQISGTSASSGLSELRPEKIGEWCFDGFTGGLFSQDNAGITLFTVNSEGHLILRTLEIVSSPSLPTLPVPSSNHASLPLPNPFKSMNLRSTEHLPEKEPSGQIAGRIVLGDETDVGVILEHGPLSGICVDPNESTARVAAWSETTLSVAEHKHGLGLQPRFTVSMSNVRRVEWVDHNSYAVASHDRIDLFSLSFDADADTVNSDSGEVIRSHSECTSSIHLRDPEAFQIVHPFGAVIVVKNSSGQRELSMLNSDYAFKTKALWQGNRMESQAYPRLTSILPLDLNVIICGYDDGRIRESSLSQLCGTDNVGPLPSRKTSDSPLPGSILAINVVENSRTNQRVLIGGGDDGSIVFWELRTLKLCARWVIFTTPLAKALQYTNEMTSGPLSGCAICVSEDGTIAVISVDGFQFLYLVPGSSALLLKIHIGGDNLLLAYADRRARLWDARTREFWRSMTTDKARELVAQGGWQELPVTPKNGFLVNDLKSLQTTSKSFDCARTLVVDMERFLARATTAVKGSKDDAESTHSFKTHIRSILSTVLTPGLNEHIDLICAQSLQIPVSSVTVGFSRHDASTIYPVYDLFKPRNPWCISPTMSASRALQIIALLRVLASTEDVSDDANTVSAYYATSLASVVGSAYRSPSLVFLARRWFDGSNEIRQAARILFETTIAKLSDEETDVLAGRWQHHLPCLQPTATKESSSAALALFLCGYLAAEKYSLLATSVLMDISKSVILYLHDEKSSHRVLAIDLCSRGFHIWQHYVDALVVLRALFTLATSSRKEVITTQSVGAQARLAVLQIASTSTPLFMTTLGLDILHPLGVEHRKSVMQIVAFLIRKRPLVLYPNLPQLMEAVVKSLDPNSTQNRDAVLDTVTEILGQVVKTFPSVDFHMTSQRLSVGTSEGAIIMYDLKTAIRLYVLEGHKKPISACSFSPDGRRLVTVSLEESVVLVWKVGSSFSSFFNPGAPPRQGHGGSDPFKTLPFAVVEGHMSIASTLSEVRFEWTNDRSVKLNIRESVLTFST